MKNVEILTSNNVAIQYELASVIQRILAFILDAIIIGVYVLLASLASSVFWTLGSQATEIIQIILVFPVFTFYNLVSEIYMDGQTIGKKAMQIKVMKVTGENPTINDYFLRWTYRMVDVFLSAGALAAIFISSTDKGQRLGDISANTTVIKLDPDSKYTIQDILKIGKTGEYQPTYLQVTKLNDNDMLLIKNTIASVSKTPNKANKEFTLELVAKTADVLGIDTVPKNKTKFLKTLLKDYIVLTR